MIDPALSPGAIKTSMLALKMAVQQERNVAAIVLKEAASRPSFDGKGSSDPYLGNVVDIDV